MQAILDFINNHFYDIFLPLIILGFLRVAMCLAQLKRTATIRRKKGVYHSVRGNYTELGAWIVRSHVERLSIGNICLGIDLTIILIYAAVFHSLNNALYGALALYITTKVLDLVVYGQNTAKVAYIISDKYEEIMQEMLRRDMGVTLLNGKGGYTGAERPLLFCAIRKKEAVSIKRYIKELDPDAFFIVCDASEVLGEGFGEYDPQGL